MKNPVEDLRDVLDRVKLISQAASNDGLRFSAKSARRFR